MVKVLLLQCFRKFWKRAENYVTFCFGWYVMETKYGIGSKFEIAKGARPTCFSWKHAVYVNNMASKSHWIWIIILYTFSRESKSRSADIVASKLCRQTVHDKWMKLFVFKDFIYVNTRSQQTCTSQHLKIQWTCLKKNVDRFQKHEKT